MENKPWRTTAEHSRSPGWVFALPVAAATEIERFNPEGLSPPDGYSQVVIAKNPGRFIYLGGKAGITRTTASRGPGLNSRAPLGQYRPRAEAAGATREDVVEIQIYIVNLEDIDPTPVYEDVRNFFPGPQAGLHGDRGVGAGLSGPAGRDQRARGYRLTHARLRIDKEGPPARGAPAALKTYRTGHATGNDRSGFFLIRRSGGSSRTETRPSRLYRLYTAGRGVAKLSSSGSSSVTLWTPRVSRPSHGVVQR